MAAFTPNYNLKKPAMEDFADIGDINGNMDIIDSALHGLSQGFSSIDGGLWDENPVEQHNAAPAAHANLLIDGNSGEGADTSSTLQEHMVNPRAHQNLAIDGNAGR